MKPNAAALLPIVLSLLMTTMSLAQSQYAGTYYGELDEEIDVFGHTVQPRQKTNDVTASVTDTGDLTITGISVVRGTVDENGNIFVTDDGGFGFQTGTIRDGTLNMSGQHSQDGGTRVNKYWILARMNTPVTSAFPDAQEEPDNWNYVPWFGYFNGADFPWIYHQTLHSMYITGNENTALWVFFPPLQWMFTNKETFPWFFSTFINGWLYYDTSNAPAQWSCNQNTGTWFSENN